jgi:hypothetical protein
MNKNWLTENKDMYVAREVISQYGIEEAMNAIFEMQVDYDGNVKKIKLSQWVLVLTKYFRNCYGNDNGDVVMQKVISSCIVNGHQVH